MRAFSCPNDIALQHVFNNRLEDYCPTQLIVTTCGLFEEHGAKVRFVAKVSGLHSSAGHNAHQYACLQVFSRRQATLVKVCKLITGGRSKEQVVVGFGDASVGHSSCLPRP